MAEDLRAREVLGYAGIEVSALLGETDLISIPVAPAHCRRAVGSTLMEWIVRQSRRMGIGLLWLRVRASNRSARRFYRAMGFEQRGRFDGHYCDPGEPAIITAIDHGEGRGK